EPAPAATGSLFDAEDEEQAPAPTGDSLFDVDDDTPTEPTAPPTAVEPVEATADSASGEYTGSLFDVEDDDGAKATTEPEKQQPEEKKPEPRTDADPHEGGSLF